MTFYHYCSFRVILQAANPNKAKQLMLNARLWSFISSAELRDGEQDECGQESNIPDKDQIYENQIQISATGVCSQF